LPKVSLSDRFVSGIKAVDGTRTDFFDEKNPGLALRVSPGGQKSWTFHFTSPKDGKRARATLGTYPATSLAAARTRATEARQLAEAGQDPRDVLAERAAGAMTVATLVDSYVEKHVRPNLRTAKETERRFQKNVVSRIGAVKVADLHRRDMNRVVDPILARGRPTEAARAFEDVRAMLRWAYSRGDIDRNPVDGMKKPATAAARERVLSDDEIRTLWAGLPQMFAKSKATQGVVKLCFATLQRVGEVAGMDLAEIDFSAKVWKLPGARTKNGYAHTVPLSDFAISLIKEVVGTRKTGFVFPNTEGEGHLHPRSVAKNIAAAQRVKPGTGTKRSTISHWTAHDLRRTGVTGMARLGVAPIVLGHVINHRSVTKAGVTLAVYSQYDYQKEKAEALGLWADRLGAIVAGEVAEIVQFQKPAKK
jgi:integrase